MSEPFEVPDTVAEMDMTLIGKHFHTLLEKHGIEYPGWQGRIIGRIGVDHVMVQLFSWMDGSPTVKRVQSYHQLTKFALYDSAEAMNLAYRNLYEPRRNRIAELDKKAIRDDAG